METIIQMSILFFSCLVFNCIIKDFMSMNFSKKKKGNYAIYFIILILINTYINIFGNTYLNYCWTFILYLILTSILYDGDNIYFLTFILISLILIFENVTWFMTETLYTILNYSSKSLFYFMVLETYVMLIFIYKPIRSIISRNKISKDNKQNFAEYVILFISFVIMMLLSFFMHIDLPIHLLAILVFVCISLLMLDIYIVFILGAKNTNLQLQEELDLLHLQQELNEEYIQEKFKQYDQQMKMMHDMKNHIRVIEQMYQNGEDEHAKRYSEQLMDRLQTNSIAIGNRVLKILVTQLIEKCNLARIHFTYKVDSRITFGNIKDVDIISLYSNLFDNAFRAAQQCDEGRIELKIFVLKGMVVTRLTNTYQEELKIKDGKLLSTKAKHKGYGIINIQEIANKYEGFYEFDYHDHQFIGQLYLPLEEEFNE